MILFRCLCFPMHRLSRINGSRSCAQGLNVSDPWPEKLFFQTFNDFSRTSVLGGTVKTYATIRNFPKCHSAWKNKSSTFRTGTHHTLELGAWKIHLMQRDFWPSSSNTSETSIWFCLFGQEEGAGSKISCRLPHSIFDETLTVSLQRCMINRTFTQQFALSQLANFRHSQAIEAIN